MFPRLSGYLFVRLLPLQKQQRRTVVRLVAGLKLCQS